LFCLVIFLPLILIAIRYTLYYRFGNLTPGASNAFVHAFDTLIYDIKSISNAQMDTQIKI